MLELKIGRYTYSITEYDIFMDNGSCVQLLSQSQEKVDWGIRPNPTLSKAAIAKIERFKRISRPDDYGDRVQVFSLVIGDLEN